jgi:hypothetical protein
MREIGSVMLGLIALAGCSDVKASDPGLAAKPARQVMIVIDVSGSRDARELAEGKELLDRVLGTLSFRDRVVLIEMHEANGGGRERWADTMPAARRPTKPTAADREALENAVRAARAVAPVFFDSTRVGHVRTTDVFGTLRTVAEYQRDAGDRQPVLVMLSDMLHSMPGMEMSHAGSVPALSWIERKQQEGTLPRLDDACVIVVGADYSTQHLARVRQFWMDYFAAAGAHLPERNYRRTITPGAPLECA